MLTSEQLAEGERLRVATMGAEPGADSWADWERWLLLRGDLLLRCAESMAALPEPGSASNPEYIADLERTARSLWGERQELCAQHGADITMPIVGVRADVLAQALERLERTQREIDALKAPIVEVDAVFHEMMRYVGKMALSDYGALNRASIFLSRARAALQAPQP